MGWTQQRIAKAKGFSQPKVAERLKYANLSEKVLDCFIRNDFLKEGHAAEIVKLSDSDNLDPWLTREDAMLHVVNSVTKNATFTANHFRKAVDRINEDAPAMGNRRAFLRKTLLRGEEEKMNLLHIFTDYIVQVVIIWVWYWMLIIVLCSNLSAIVIDGHVVLIGFSVVIVEVELPFSVCVGVGDVV